MLCSLHISNYALIESLDLNFESGFSVITGETGAGKSIMLGALGLLLGQRADTKAIRQNCDKCIIEGTFDLRGYNLKSYFEENDLEYDEQECTLRRELTASGKSRSFINDTPASLNQMKELGAHLIDVHSQHQNLLLGQESFQLNVLDMLAAHESLLQAYQKSYLQYKSDSRALEELRAIVNKNRDDEDYLRFQLAELKEAALNNENEQEELEQEAAQLEHTEEIKNAFQKVLTTLNGDDNNLLQTLRDDSRSLDEIAKMYVTAADWTARMESCHIELKELCREVDAAQERIEFNPERLQQINDRLNVIFRLQQKHHVGSIKELAEIFEKLQKQVGELDLSDDRLLQLEELVKKDNLLLVDHAKKLTKSRLDAVKGFETEMLQSLLRMGMPNVRFQVQVEKKNEMDLSGEDRVVFLFSANKNVELQPLSQIASGGEIARVMFAVKSMIARITLLPTIIFDEIDTGLSGGMAQRMGLLMREMGCHERRQVLCITHLPQIAALGLHHYKVSKSEGEIGTHTNIKPLDENERITEVARLMSGEEITAAALDNARELMNETSNE